MNGMKGSNKDFDAVVVGAGIVGAACALACAREGLRVAVVEAGPVGGEATAAGMGHIVVMDDSEAQFALTRYSQQLWMQLARELPAGVEYERRGTLWIACDEEEFALAEAKFAYYRERGAAVRLLPAAALTAAEPGLRGGLAGALEVRDDAVLYAPAAANWLLERALGSQAVLFQERAVALESGAVRLQSGAVLCAPRIVNAAGEWAARLSPGLAIRRRKGHLAISDRYPGMLRHPLVELGYLHRAHSSDEDSVAFNVQPRATGQILIGSSRQYVASDSGAEDSSAALTEKQVDESILGDMLRRAVSFLPGLASTSILRVWTGFRAATPDMLPYIGPSPRDPSVYLAAGHEGLGISTSLATARLLADSFAGRQPAISLEPYLPSRPMRGFGHA